MASIAGTTSNDATAVIGSAISVRTAGNVTARRARGATVVSTRDSTGCAKGASWVLKWPAIASDGRVTA